MEKGIHRLMTPRNEVALGEFVASQTHAMHYCPFSTVHRVALVCSLIRLFVAFVPKTNRCEWGGCQARPTCSCVADAIGMGLSVNARNAAGTEEEARNVAAHAVVATLCFLRTR